MTRIERLPAGRQGLKRIFYTLCVLCGFVGNLYGYTILLRKNERGTLIKTDWILIEKSSLRFCPQDSSSVYSLCALCPKDSASMKLYFYPEDTRIEKKSSSAPFYFHLCIPWIKQKRKDGGNGCRLPY